MHSAITSQKANLGRLLQEIVTSSLMGRLLVTISLMLTQIYILSQEQLKIDIPVA